jgi:hypothetical protein
MRITPAALCLASAACSSAVQLPHVPEHHDAGDSGGDGDAPSDAGEMLADAALRDAGACASWESCVEACRDEQPMGYSSFNLVGSSCACASCEAEACQAGACQLTDPGHADCSNCLQTSLAESCPTNGSFQTYCSDDSDCGKFAACLAACPAEGTPCDQASMKAGS